jgi:hypothetical protein
MPPSDTASLGEISGRKVYLAVAHAIATVLVRGNDCSAVRMLRRELGASRSTLRRWRAWCQALVGSAPWQRLRGQLPVDLDESISCGATPTPGEEQALRAQRPGWSLQLRFSPSRCSIGMHDSGNLT